MSVPLSLVAIIGSLRADSFNRAVFTAAQQLLGETATLTEVPIRDVPLYDGDLEAAGDPATVVAMKDAVAAADGLIVFTPEYNRSTPAVTKNAIDWLSRMPGSSVLSEAKVGIVAASPGGHTAAGVRDHLGTSIGANTEGFYPTSLGIGSIHQKLADGAFTDAAARDELAQWLAGFVEFVEV